jgi:hypothetical protein
VDEAHLKLNLSYVLHEPSTSRTVRQAARTSRGFARRKGNLLRAFSRLSDADLRACVVLHPRTADALRGRRPRDGIITASIGLPDLIARCIEVTQDLRDTGNITIVDSPSPHLQPTEVEFFGATAGLNFGEEVSEKRESVVAGLIVRPGGESLMLTATRINVGSENHVDGRVCRELESLIREFVDQWTPEKTLWDIPAERGIPEVLRAVDSSDRFR